MSKTFENIYLDVMELEGQPATVHTIIDALYKPDTGIHEEIPQEEEGGVYICDCGICQNLVPALLQIGKEIAALREVVQAVANLEAHELGTFAEFGNIPNEDMEDEYMRTLLYAVYESMRKARAAGYLEAINEAN
jgi:hypothetical protein